MTGPHGVERDVDRIAEPGEDRRDRGGAEQPAGRRPARQLTVAVAATVLVAVVLMVGLTLGLSRLWAAETDVPVAPAALLVAGVVGVLVGGLLAVLLARRSVAPLLAVIGRQQRFVADTRQELQTPLTVVYLRAQLIARRTPPDDPALPAIRQLQGPMLRKVRDALTDPQARRRGLFADTEVQRMLADPNTTRTTLGSNALWQLGLLEMWLQHHGVGA